MSEGELAVGVAVALSGEGQVVRRRREDTFVTPANVLTTPLVLSRPGPTRVRADYVERLRENLSVRDWAVLEDVGRLRLVTSLQLERLHFTELAQSSRSVVRRRVLARLVRARCLQTLERRIGGVRSGSDGLVFGLDTAGARLLTAAGRRRTEPPGERYTRHVLAVTELYVALVEQARANGDMELVRFAAEPGSWWPDGRGGSMKPDAYALMASAVHRDSWWLEVDRATESLPTIKRKLLVYLDFYNRGQFGPGKVMPWILITVPDEKRRGQIEELVRRLPGDGETLFTVALHNEATTLIMGRLNGP